MVAAKTAKTAKPAKPARKEAALKVGAHTSIAGGLHLALERGAAIGADVIQIFASSNKQWAAKPLTDEALESWTDAREKTGIEPAMVHSSYLVNLAATTRDLQRLSYQALARDYERCGQLGIPYLVLHPGAHLGDGTGTGIHRAAALLERLFDDQPDNPTLVLFENTAGQGTCLGHRFEELRDLLGATKVVSRTGLCIDTCHLLAAGYDARTKEGFDLTFRTLDEVVGLEHVKAFHMNDSKTDVGGRVDRHEHIGRGHLGLSAFQLLVADARFRGLPMVLETPKPDDQADVLNLKILRALERPTGLASAKRFRGELGRFAG